MEPASDPASPALVTPAQTLPKFSRYRSVRHAAAKAQHRADASASSAAPALPNVSQNARAAAKPQNDTIARSMSRYRRGRPAATPPAAATSVPTVPPEQRYQAIPPTDPTVMRQAEAQGKLEKKQNPAFAQAPVPEKALGQKHAFQSTQVVEDDGEDELSSQEKERIRKETMEKLSMAEKPHAPAPDSSRSRERQAHRQKTLEKKREQRRSSQESTETSRSWKERLGLSRTKPPVEEHQSHDNANDTTKVQNIEPSGHGNGPGIDAPVSAVNAGERRVTVKCNALSIILPVTPTTRAKDIIFSALNCLSEPGIDPKTAIVLESFSQLGLERPLRRYEHVRDVMNSWATDTQNTLIITPLPFDGAGEKLEVEAAPREQPKDVTFHLYHSQRYGKWDKRFITLRADGQVIVSKKQAGKQSTNICHLSDFDIYSPTQRQLSKKIKPPKKLCFAVKSQQKSSMFLSTENFVHFFCTSDADLAQNWYDAVHRWRSWYLVNVLGEGQKKDASQISSTIPGNISRSTSRHKRNISTDSTPYQLGSFQPLVDLDSIGEIDTSAPSSNKKTDEATASGSRDMYLRRKQTRDHPPPPSSFPTSLAVNTEGTHPESQITSPEDDDSSTFSPTGLLGRTYSERRRAQREREVKLAGEASEGPFVAHGLLSTLSSPTSQSSSPYPLGDLPSRQASQRSTIHSKRNPEADRHGRSNSNRQQHKPLVDLTPTWKEPPQHARKGHGVRVAPGVPLVEVATGPELAPGAINIPPATAWRRPEPQARPATSRDASATIAARRRANSVQSQQLPGSDLSSPVSPDSPFIPGGLLAMSAQAPTSYATLGTGRGVVTGDRHASRPLLDMTPTSEFAEGSLLRSLERGT
jgi:hypothetical protein